MYCAADDDTYYTHAISARSNIYVCTDRRRGTREFSGAPSVLSAASLAYVHTRRPRDSLRNNSPRETTPDQTVVTPPPPPSPPPSFSVVVAHPPATSTVHADDSRARAHAAAAAFSSHVLYSSDQPSGHRDNNTNYFISDICIRNRPGTRTPPRCW